MVVEFVGAEDGEAGAKDEEEILSPSLEKIERHFGEDLGEECIRDFKLGIEFWGGDFP